MANLLGGVRGSSWYVKVEGLEEMIRDLEELAKSGGDMEKDVDQMLRKVAGKCKNWTSQTCPEGETGKLKASIRMKKAGKLVYEVLAGSDTYGQGAYYAPFVEWGTRKMAGRHFMLQAYMMSLIDWMAEIENLVGGR